MPEVNLRSLTLDEPDHARVIYILKNVPGVLRKGKRDRYAHTRKENADVEIVNEVLSDHNVDKQISDSRGEVSRPGQLTWLYVHMLTQCSWHILWRTLATSRQMTSRRYTTDSRR